MRLPQPIATLWPDVAAALPAAWQQPLVDARPAGAGRPRAARVWRLTLAGGRSAALKLAAGGAPLDGEIQALALLGAQGAPVPPLLAAAPARPAAWLVTAWCGDQTLDEALQEADAARTHALGAALAGAVAAVETAFAPLTRRLQADAAAWQTREHALRSQARPWASAAAPALAWLLGRDLDSAAGRALDATLDVALATPASAGSLDYTARNVAADGERLTLLDFSAVGVDWAERRFVQYGTATGGATLGGTFATAVTPHSAHVFAGALAALHGRPEAEALHAVDAHHLFLLAIAAAQLRTVSEGAARRQRAAAWTNVPERRRRLLGLLCRPVAPDGPAASLRACLSRLTPAP